MRPMAAITAAPPAMSPFMVAMPEALLMSRPPLSKVIPLPSSPREPDSSSGSPL